MHIVFRSSGGFVPLELAYSVDTEQLPDDRARELADLVAQADVWDLAQPGPTPGAMDATSYWLRVQDGARVRQLEVDDASAPAPLRPLLARLRGLALEERRAAPGR